MRAAILAAVLVLSGFGAALPVFEPVRIASACTCPDCDAFRDSPIVIRGTVQSWDFVRDRDGHPVERPVESLAGAAAGATPAAGQAPERESVARERPIEIEVEVDSVFRGSVSNQIVLRRNSTTVTFALRAHLRSLRGPGQVKPGSASVSVPTRQGRT